MQFESINSKSSNPRVHNYLLSVLEAQNPWELVLPFVPFAISKLKAILNVTTVCLIPFTCGKVSQAATLNLECLKQCDC